MRVLLFTMFSLPLWAAPIPVVTSLPDLAWAARQIGKDRVSVQSLLKGTENPHFAEATPDFIRRVADAQAVCGVGLDLEVGWLPKVLSRSGNAAVQPGGKGFCETGSAIAPLDKPTGKIDRSMGDVHPLGNPHFWLSPVAFAEGAKVIADTLSRLDPPHASEYQGNWKDLKIKLTALAEENKKKIQGALGNAKGPVLLEYHREFSYFLETYGLTSWGSLEEKPGVAPSAGRLAQVAEATKTAGVRVLLAGDTAPKNLLNKFKELSGATLVTVPLSVRREGEYSDYEVLQKHVVDSLVKAIEAAKTPRGKSS